MPEIRRIREEDTDSFLRLCTELDRETAFMMLEADERDQSRYKQRLFIKDILSRSNCNLLVIENGGDLIGYILGLGGEYQRNAHKVHIIIGIRQEFAGMGWGRELFNAFELWAKDEGLHRMELTVMTHNTNAIGLYKKMGFEIESEIRDSVKIDDRYVNEYMMVKFLNDEKQTIT